MAILKNLSQQGAQVRALVRNQTQADKVTVFKGVEVAYGDLLNETSLEDALQGIKVLYFICPNMSPDELKIGTNLIRLAKKQQVQRFVYHSVLHPQIEEMPHHWQKMRMEETLLASGLDFTILQPCAYMQNILGGWKNIQAGRYVVPYNPEARISIVDLEDIGKVAAKVLLETGFSNAIFELAGPEALSQIEVAEKISETLKQKVTAIQQPHAEWKENAINAGLPALEIEWLLTMFNYYDHYGLTGNSLVLEYLLGVSPTTFNQFLNRIQTSGGTA
jgi:uncharacterized protein YbjT (DUF2867 family)